MAKNAGEAGQPSSRPSTCRPTSPGPRLPRRTRCPGRSYFVRASSSTSRHRRRKARESSRRLHLRKAHFTSMETNKKSGNSSALA
eukprot:2061417-Pyramimonas_sp.AAC.1